MFKPHSNSEVRGCGNAGESLWLLICWKLISSCLRSELSDIRSGSLIGWWPFEGDSVWLSLSPCCPTADKNAPPTNKKTPSATPTPIPALAYVSRETIQIVVE